MTQVDAALRIWRDDRKHFHERVIVEVLDPNMEMINRKLGQENSAAYIAYALEYVFTQTESPPR